MDGKSLPVACSLTKSEFQERRQSVLRKVGDAVAEVRETTAGYAYRFSSDDDLLAELADLIALERRCCPFLRFSLTVEPAGGPLWLELTGPDGTKQFLASLFS